ncbi:phage gp6-like head-tail connector protein [Acidaminobacter sp. JC074]|uniref:head-tail connector protein n=1 Tax=Acidaminobacter sp. JC074 TaxID=2530199 RepID=UPI001F0EDD1F|nr:head-tail connector protein [Acidaminobacter sp. JC074]MCH4891185.1 phage gp6-like head-tail connector protein [Acidaminobacter sp. JC074]
MVTLAQAKEFLHLDVEDHDEDAILNIIIKAAEEYLKEATGKSFDATNNRAVLFMLVLINDFYENREMIGKPSDKVRETITSIKLQLKYGGE